MSGKELLLCATADEGSRTLVSSLEGWGNSRYTTSAELLKNIIYWYGTSRLRKANKRIPISLQSNRY